MPPSSDTTNPHPGSAHQLVLLALKAALVTLAIAAVFPSGKPADELMSLSFGATYGWIASQAFALVFPGLAVGLILATLAPRLGAVVGAALVFAVPLIVLCDVLTFTWIAERFLSSTTGRITTTLLPSLMLHVSRQEIVSAIVTLAIVSALIVLCWKVSHTIGHKWHAKEDSAHPLAVALVMVVIASCVAIPACWNLDRTISEMAKSSTRHPFCAFHLVGYHGVGKSRPDGRVAVLSRLKALHAAPAVIKRDVMHQEIGVDIGKWDPESTARKNVIIVVIECLRPDVIDPSVMPNLHAFAEKSILCRGNFTNGNATCFGMFSLVTGLEAIWFDRPVSRQPILNRLLHQAGYRIGFYGGQDDWRHFKMDGYVRPELFDDFRIEYPDLPATDLRTVERAVEFIGNPSDQPSASIAYMFATHAGYSEEADQVFQPAAAENILISHQPEMKQQVFNRYKNSVRTMDRMIQPLLRDDCVVIVLGDHGEPFLDDGTAKHGTRLSRFQNMTPACIYYPGVVPRVIDAPTMHADLLPTLMAILEIPVNKPGVFDGVNLVTAQDSELTERMFLSRNYLDSTSMIVGPWTSNSSPPFAHRVVFDISNWQADYLNPIDEIGLEIEPSTGVDGAELFKRWIVERFGAESYCESSSEAELFAQFMDSEFPEIRLSALRIASDVSNPDDKLYDLVASATNDPDPEIREFAKNLIIQMNR